ncbi:MAG: LUD domain-containing protein, partial [Planctomycetes bacterium]|nr:LUD domain-containing protein [Planctomycetota bacterium]
MNQGLKTFRRLYLGVLENDALKAKYSNVLARFRNERDKSLLDFADNAEGLREQGSEIRDYSVAHMPELVEEFSKNFKRNGGKIVFADTTKDAAVQIHNIIKAHNAQTVIKTKSMMTEEIRLNELLDAEGITVVETDLGEFIVQLAGDKPAHIVAPALHKDRHDVSTLFSEKLGTAPTDNIETLTRIARENLREVFKSADVGITGANFLVAQTGSACVVTNEGNGRICATLPKILITVAGVDKITSKFSDLAVLQPLLMR